ncbi:MAG: DUF3391 domain-containing protein, partial [Rubrivivax sp.]
MLKKIPVRDLQLGMHLHKLEGSWLSHPFWRAKFVVTSDIDLQQIHACGVCDCWIDTAHGLDVGAPAAVAVAAVAATAGAAAMADAPALSNVASASASSPALSPALSPASATPEPTAGAAPRPPPRQPKSRPLADELKQAAAICQRGRESVLAMFAEARMGRTVNAERCLPLVEDITASVARNPGALVSLARLKSADDYSFMHSVAVCALMVALSRQLGRDDDECREAGIAGLMHDIGKAVMPLAVLNKPGKLTDA